MNAQNNDRIIDKIRKLLAVANSSATGNGVEHERDIAMKQAVKLMAKHNLEMKDIDVADKEDRDMVQDEHFPCPFRRVVANAVAEMFFCKFYFAKVPNKQKYNFHFVGLESNCVTAMEMTRYLVKSLDNESAKAQKDAGQSAGWGTTFRNAASRRISERCREFRAEAEAEAEQATPGNALVLASLYDTEREANQNYIVKVLGIGDLVKKTAKLSNKSASASAQGRAFGDKINLTNQIAGTAAATQQAPVVVAGLLK